MSASHVKPSGRKESLDHTRRLKMAASAHAYVRGNTSQFYDWVTSDAIPKSLPIGPSIWICGDCHIGNLGPVADQAGNIEIQIRDLDQTVIGNPAHDLLRLGLSLAMAARSSDLPGITTALIVEVLIKGYLQGLSGQKPKVKASRITPVQTVIKSALNRKWRHLAEERIEDVEPHIPLGQKFWPLEKSERASLTKLFESEEELQIVWGRSKDDHKEDAKLLDAAYWVKGCSSLGRLRYAVLLQVGKKKARRHRLIDVKEAVKSVAPIAKGSDMPANHAERVITGARHLSPFLGDRMARADLGGRQVVLRELRPQDLKFEFAGLSQEDAILTAGLLAGVVGKAHGRQMTPVERASWTKDLRKTHSEKLNAPSWLWKGVVNLVSIHEAAYLDHCRDYALSEARGIVKELLH
jgi:uncharacterized protein (DUF2252 family)